MGELLSGMVVTNFFSWVNFFVSDKNHRPERQETTKPVKALCVHLVTRQKQKKEGVFNYNNYCIKAAARDGNIILPG